MESIIHVEHDPVAVEVIKWNHENDGISHHYITKFEEIYGENREVNDELLHGFISEYGPFSIVTSGAPCQNLSGINAHRSMEAENAQYLMKVGKLIMRLNSIQRGNGVKEHVLFLSENVVFKEAQAGQEIDVQYSDSIEGLSPMCLDAKDFGPVKRNRLYWANVSIEYFDMTLYIFKIDCKYMPLILFCVCTFTDASQRC